jgi:RNA polymerase sigma factor (sigma-70 family)
LEHLELAELALEGDPAALDAVMAMLRSPELMVALRSRGASDTEAADIVADVTGDCFGGERAKGGLHRLLGRYNGACPLPAFLRHVAINRLISLKRKQARRPLERPDENGGGDPLDRIAAPDAPESADAELILLLRDAIVKAFATVDPEKLVLFRLVHSYGVSQKRVGSLWGMPEWTISRKLDSLRDDLKEGILAEVHRVDRWLQVEWEDLLALCSESVDLFGD